MTDAADIARPKIIGARIKRTEDPRLLTGLGSYTDDRQVARVLHVAFRRSEHAHARIVSVDCAAARAAPGVVAVLTAEDLENVKPLLATSRMKGYYATPILPLARHKVRHVGEAIVGVVAESRYLAEDAARADRHRFRAAGIARRRDPAARRARRAAAARGSRHQCARRARVQARRRRCGVRAEPPVQGRRPLPHAPPYRVGDRAARVSRRIRAGPRCAHASFGDANPRHHPRRACRRARSAGSSPARRRAGRRRRLRRQGLALSGGDFRLRGGAAARARREMDQRPHGGPCRHQPGVRRDRRCRARARRATDTCWRCAPT